MNIAVVGVGLIGGSMMLKLKEKQAVTTVFGIDRNENHLKTALSRGIIDQCANLEEGVKKADLILIATPVDTTQTLLPKVLDLVDSKKTVMDVGSTKTGITTQVEYHPMRSRYVAFHPMWGTENSGPQAASNESFSGRAAVICDPEKSAKDALKTVLEIIETLEMYPVYMNADAHDLHTAYISHISHITSYALANTVLEKEKEEDTIFQLASSGFSSTVRLAKSHPDMWVPIFKQNKENVLDVLNEHLAQLRKFKSALEKENWILLEELITNANRIRNLLDKKS
ncbi:prephenate dehydrogenase [Bergeyella sp. RCAD1439]|uniref:prephenate dehydrogenase n=1 Tax=Bergeyella anatis TaxID=3113737 RepID=UPI002E175F5C|nr:prephenate dehydrogenase [Bergeyella sp. RCAD1439]